MSETQMEEGDTHKDIEVAPALIAVHPTQESVAVAVGSDLRVFDLHGGCAVSLVDDSCGPFHNDSIRAIRYGAKGKLFVSAGDDKLVKIWSTESWRCICTVSSEKRVSAVALSNDGLYVCFADKFGVVWVVDLNGLDRNQVSTNKKAAPLLAHYCSIITGLEFSPDGRFIVSADRDFKIRVTVFPKEPLHGGHEIQSFCLGHTEFVTCLAFVSASEYPQGFLVSGSGDSTVRLWNISSGSLLDTFEVEMKAGCLESIGKGEEYSSAVTDLCTIWDGTMIAVAIQRQVAKPSLPCYLHDGFFLNIIVVSLAVNMLDCSFQGVVVLSCDLSAQTLSIAKVFSMEGECFIPTSLSTGSSAGLLWMVAGVSNLRGFDNPSLTRVRVISGFEKSSLNPPEHQPTVLEDEEIPGGDQLLEKLQGSVSVEQKVFLAAAEAVKSAMSNLLVKKQYCSETREFRKRTRNDKKN